MLIFLLACTPAQKARYLNRLIESAAGKPFGTRYLSGMANFIVTLRRPTRRARSA